jgi:hypothetical protein
MNYDLDAIEELPADILDVALPSGEINGDETNK